MLKVHIAKFLFVFSVFWSCSAAQNVTLFYGKTLVSSPSAATQQKLLIEQDSNFIYVAGCVSTNAAPSDFFVSKIDKATGGISGFQMYGNTSTGQEIQTSITRFSSDIFVAGTTSGNLTGADMTTIGIPDGLVIRVPVTNMTYSASLIQTFGGQDCVVEFPSVAGFNGTSIAVAGFISQCTGEFDTHNITNTSLFFRLMDAVTLDWVQTVIFPTGSGFQAAPISLIQKPNGGVVYLAAPIGDGANYFGCAASDQVGSIAVLALATTDMNCIWGKVIQDKTVGKELTLGGLSLSFHADDLALAIKTSPEGAINLPVLEGSTLSQYAVLKLSVVDGTPIPLTYYNGADSQDQLRSIRFDQQGNVFVLQDSPTSSATYLRKFSAWTGLLEWTHIFADVSYGDVIMESGNTQDFYTTFRSRNGDFYTPPAPGPSSVYGRYQQTIYPSVTPTSSVTPSMSPSTSTSPSSSSTPSPSGIPSTSVTPTPFPNEDNKKKDNITLIAGISVAGGFVILVLIASFVVFFVRRSRKRNQEDGAAQVEMVHRATTSKIQEKNLTQITDIEILAKIGSGNFGEVFKGKWQGTTDVALKKLKNKDLQEEFFSEASMMQELSMPNIVRFFGIFTDPEGYFYLVTEFMIRGCLLEVLRVEANLLPFDLLRMALDAAAGMKYIASKGVVHRDLAARNLLVKEEDYRLVVKVADFGLSRLLTSSYYSATGSLFPVKWSPPEVLSHEKYTSKSDVWSFGIVLWEIFSFGAVPYPGKSNDEAMKLVLSGYRMPKPDACPQAVYQLMLKCWEEKANARPDFEEIFTQLQKEVISIKEELIQNSKDIPINSSINRPVSMLYSDGLAPSDEYQTSPSSRSSQVSELYHTNSNLAKNNNNDYHTGTVSQTKSHYNTK